MCLFVGNKITLVAKKDITVYKYVKITFNGFVTAFQDTPVTLNSTLKPDTEVENPWRENSNKYCIEGGVIHAYITTIGSGLDYRYRCFKATIPKGTTYYVQDDFKEIAAKELYITDEEVTDAVTTPDMKIICEDYLNAVLQDDSYANKNGVHIGDFCLYDKTYVSPLSDFNHADAIGIVAYFDKDGNPIVMALDEVELLWPTAWSAKNKVCSNINETETINDFDGKKHTYDITTSRYYDPANFKDINYCTQYKTQGTEEGDWYLPAIGECVKLSQNMCILNASILYTGCGDPITFGWMWSSSEFTSGCYPHVWGCYYDNGDCNSYSTFRDNEYKVHLFTMFQQESTSASATGVYKKLVRKSADN